MTDQRTQVASTPSPAVSGPADWGCAGVASLDSAKLAALHSWHRSARADADQAADMEAALGHGVETAVLEGVLELLYSSAPAGASPDVTEASKVTRSPDPNGPGTRLLAAVKGALRRLRQPAGADR